MKKLPVYFLLFALTLFSSCKENKPKESLPDVKLINEVIDAIINHDTLYVKFDINLHIINPIIYNPFKYLDNSVPPPPPQPGSISFQEVYETFSSLSRSNNRILDSIYVNQQVSDIKPININKNIIKLSSEKQRKKPHFVFSKPIFNRTKDCAIILYGISSGICGYEYCIVMKKLNSKWINISQNEDRSWIH